MSSRSRPCWERRPTQAEEGDGLRGQENHAEGRPSIAMCGSNWIFEASSDNDPNVELVVIRMLEAGMNAGRIYSTKRYALRAGQRRNMRVLTPNGLRAGPIRREWLMRRCGVLSRK